MLTTISYDYILTVHFQVQYRVRKTSNTAFPIKNIFNIKTTRTKEILTSHTMLAKQIEMLTNGLEMNDTTIDALTKNIAEGNRSKTVKKIKYK